jgi:hypothetical protein
MRLGKWAAVLAALPLLLGGCGAGSSTSGATSSASASASPAVPWLINATGSPTPSPSPSISLSPSPSDWLWTPLPTAPSCDIDWPANRGQVLIPMIVTPLKASLKVQWPSWYGPNYRVAAVNQVLVTGTQPPPTWVNVTAGSGCTVTATLTGLISGNPYIVWLDAPNTPVHLDGSRSLYSGKTAVVKPL